MLAESECRLPNVVEGKGGEIIVSGWSSQGDHVAPSTLQENIQGMSEALAVWSRIHIQDEATLMLRWVGRMRDAVGVLELTMTLVMHIDMKTSKLCDAGAAENKEADDVAGECGEWGLRVVCIILCSKLHTRILLGINIA